MFSHCWFTSQVEVVETKVEWTDDHMSHLGKNISKVSQDRNVRKFLCLNYA
jgi:hypothetical protein